MRGVYTLSGDGCLFAETFVINYVRRQTAGSKWGDAVSWACSAWHWCASVPVCCACLCACPPPPQRTSMRHTLMRPCLPATTFCPPTHRTCTALYCTVLQVVNMIQYYVGPANATATFDPSSLLPAGVDDTPIAPLLIYLPLEAKEPVANIYVLMQVGGWVGGLLGRWIGGVTVAGCEAGRVDRV